MLFGIIAAINLLFRADRDKQYERDVKRVSGLTNRVEDSLKRVQGAGDLLRGGAQIAGVAALVQTFNEVARAADEAGSALARGEISFAEFRTRALEGIPVLGGFTKGIEQAIGAWQNYTAAAARAAGASEETARALESAALQIERMREAAKAGREADGVLMNLRDTLEQVNRGNLSELDRRLAGVTDRAERRRRQLFEALSKTEGPANVRESRQRIGLERIAELEKIERSRIAASSKTADALASQLFKLRESEEVLLRLAVLDESGNQAAADRAVFYKQQIDELQRIQAFEAEIGNRDDEIRFFRAGGSRDRAAADLRGGGERRAQGTGEGPARRTRPARARGQAPGKGRPRRGGGVEQKQVRRRGSPPTARRRRSSVFANGRSSSGNCSRAGSSTRRNSPAGSGSSTVSSRRLAGLRERRGRTRSSPGLPSLRPSREPTRRSPTTTRSIANLPSPNERRTLWRVSTGRHNARETRGCSNGECLVA